MRAEIRSRRGFTLIELLVAVAIGLAILAAVGGTFITQSKALYSQEQANEMQQNARAAMDLMVREIRMAGYNPTGAAFSGVAYHATEMNIQADLNGDGDTTGADENVTYTFDAENRTIVRNSGGTPQVLAGDIQSFTFQYLDKEGDATNQTPNICQIRVNISARTAYPVPNPNCNGEYQCYNLTAVITPPNLALWPEPPGNNC